MIWTFVNIQISRKVRITFKRTYFSLVFWHVLLVLFSLCQQHIHIHFFLIEIIVSSHTVVRNRAEIGCTTYPVPPSCNILLNYSIISQVGYRHWHSLLILLRFSQSYLHVLICVCAYRFRHTCVPSSVWFYYLCDFISIFSCIYLLSVYPLWWNVYSCLFFFFFAPFLIGLFAFLNLQFWEFFTL